MNMENIFSNKVTGLKGSTIREIFKLIKQPDIISFAGGLPAPEMFPNQELADISKEILEKQGTIALQYGITEGYDPLRDMVRENMQAVGVLKGNDEAIIVSGAQQGIDLTAKVLLNEQDGVIVENPSFVGGLNAFRAYNASMYSVDVKEDGMDLDQLENLLSAHSHIKLIYTIPTFQNPSGITMSLEKRKQLLQLAKKYNVFIIEDNPYGELRFKGEAVATLKSIDDENRVIYVGSFSKTLSPGLRLGWLVAHPEIVEKVLVVKQVNDVHTTMLAQMLATEYMKKYSMDEHITKISALYGEKCEFMLTCMDKYFPDFCNYTRPEGGLFIWCTLPDRYNAIALMKESVKHKVAFVPGNTFMVDMEKPSNCFRLNYSIMSMTKIEEGIKILGKVLENF